MLHNAPARKADAMQAMLAAMYMRSAQTPVCACISLARNCAANSEALVCKARRAVKVKHTKRTDSGTRNSTALANSPFVPICPYSAAFIAPNAQPSTQRSPMTHGAPKQENANSSSSERHKKDENSEEENTCQNALEHRTRKSSAA